MVDRIDKTQLQEPWKVRASARTREDKKREQKKDQHAADSQDSREAFEESSDFIQLLSKDPQHYQSETLDSQLIKGLTFRGINTHREQATLEVDISMKNGALLQGAQIALSRQEGMHYIGTAPGTSLAVESIIKGPFLTVAIPQESHKLPQAKQVFAEHLANRKKPMLPLAKIKMINWYYVLGFGAIVIALFLLTYLLIPGRK